MPVRKLPYALAAAALAAALAPALPAAAAPAPGCPAVSGSASADLLRLSTGVRVASSTVQMSGSRTTATARAVDGPVPASGVVQQAPPAASKRLASTPVDLGVAHVGTGDLRANATWPNGYRCGAASAPGASASTSLADATVLPGMAGTGAVRLAGSLSSGADLALSVRDGHLATSVTARVGLADVRLLGGSVRVRVLAQATLTATAGGSVARSAVHYTAPIYEVTGPAGTTRRLAAAEQHVDVPVQGGSTLRLSVGAVSRQVTATAVTAEAATLRVQLLSGTGATLLDLGVGVLQVNAGSVEVPVTPPRFRQQGSLPVTGANAGWLVGIGLLTAIGGRLLVLLSRRRAGSGR